MQDKIYILIAAGAIMFAVIGGLSLLAHYYTLNGIKSRTVGDGQHGTARFATKKEIQRTYKRIPFRPKRGARVRSCRRNRASSSAASGRKTRSRLWWTPTTSTR
jgi:type IV secretion system protein VirD4